MLFAEILKTKDIVIYIYFYVTWDFLKLQDVVLIKDICIFKDVFNKMIVLYLSVILNVVRKDWHIEI
jgi:hypothetical protein